MIFKSVNRYFDRKRMKGSQYTHLFDPPREGHFVVFDVETTGLDPKIDDIISIAAVKIEGNRIYTSKKFMRYIKLNRMISQESVKIHQIRSCDLEEGLTIDEMLESFLTFIGNDTLVGYYLEFDVAMIDKYLKPKLGFRLPNRQIEVSALYYDYKIGGIPQGNVDLRFETILKELRLPMMSKHDALNDAIMTAMIFLKLNHLAR